jgi:hypothetical protein
LRLCAEDVRPCCSACPDKILRATVSFCPKYLSWMFCFDNSFVSGISCLHKVNGGVCGIGELSSSILHAGEGKSNRTGMGSPCRDYIPPWRRKNIYVASCACNKALSVPAASASPGLPTTPDCHSTCSHFQAPVNCERRQVSKKTPDRSIDGCTLASWFST